MTTRRLMVLYAVVTYALFLALLAYAVGWVEGLVVPRSIDDGPEAATWVAIVVDTGLLAVFALQHSVMARPAFKRWWTRYVPAPIERTTYVLLATLALALVMWQWRPIDVVLWDLTAQPWRAIVFGVSFVGWGIVLLSTFLIDHFDLFGLRQVVRHLRGREQKGPAFQTPLLYRWVRHPLMFGFLVAFWAAPTMTGGRLLYAGVTTAHILVALRYEERDLVAHVGARYRRYQRRVPMLLPRLGRDGS